MFFVRNASCISEVSLDYVTGLFFPLIAMEKLEVFHSTHLPIYNLHGRQVKARQKAGGLYLESEVGVACQPFVLLWLQSKPPKAVRVMLNECRLKHRDPSEKLTDEQFIINDDDGKIYRGCLTFWTCFDSSPLTPSFPPPHSLPSLPFLQETVSSSQRRVQQLPWSGWWP